MRKDIALQTYLEEFMKKELPDAPWDEEDYTAVYGTESVQKDAMLPYMTYNFVDNAFLDGEVAIPITIWFHTDSEAFPNKVAMDFRNYIEINDIIRCDEGLIWLKAGSPFSQPIPGQDMEGLKGRLINLTIEYLTR